MRVIHISLDEKFIDCAINQFNQLKGVESVFCAQTKNDSFKFIKSEDVKLFHTDDELIDYVNEQGFDYVIMHSMCFAPKKLLRLNAPILWNSWGYDIYSDKTEKIEKILPMNLYKPLTRKAADKKPATVKDKVAVFLRKFGFRSNRQKVFDQLVKKIPYISVVLPKEFEAIHERDPHFKFFPFRYMDPGESYSFELNTRKDQSILLGNSLDPNNNHIDLLNILEKRQIKCKVYIPISYPEVENYKKKLKAFAQKLKFVTVRFLEDFIPKEEYFSILDECSVAIFGHIRQQAVGNIYHMFYRGRKVFMFKDSIGYKFFKEQGLKIFSVEDDLQASIFEETLSEADQRTNHQFVYNDENYETYISELQSFFDKVQKVC